MAEAGGCHRHEGGQVSNRLDDKYYPTPRTDNACVSAQKALELAENPPTRFANYHSWVRSDIARQLERELAAAQEKLAPSADGKSLSAYVDELERRAAEQKEWEDNPKCEDNGVGDAMQVIANELRALFLPAAEGRGQPEYICKCGVRVVPHRCQIGEEF